jgi:outer membrane protein assembly factor BamD
VRAAAAAVALTLAISAGCANAPPVEELPSAEVYYQRGLEALAGQRFLFFFSDVDYARAIELFQEVIDNYPYSEHAVLAEIKIADIYFDQEKYEQASSYYQDFVELHPKHAQVPYALYRHGLCSARRMGRIDQDQEATRTAIAQFEVLLERYPDSEYAGDARARLAEATDRLALHDVYVGDFYLQRGECWAAAARYRTALTEYPQHSSRLQTMRSLAAAFRCAGSDDEAVALLARILAEQPEGELREEVEGTLRAMGATFPGNGAN